jgi:hypothetical protein
MLLNAVADLWRAIVNGSTTKADLERMSKMKNFKGQVAHHFLKNYDPEKLQALKEKLAQDEKEAAQKRALLEHEKRNLTLAQDYKSYVKLSIENRESLNVFWELLKEMKAQYKEGDSISAIAQAVPAKFLNDPSLAIELIRVHAEFTAYLPSSLKSNDDFLMSALEVNVQCFKFLPISLRNDAKLVAPILERHPLLLKHCGASIQGNQCLVEACIRQSPLSFQYASEALRAKASIHVACIESHPLLIAFVPPNCLTQELVLKAFYHSDRQRLVAQAKLKRHGAFSDSTAGSTHLNHKARSGKKGHYRCKKQITSFKQAEKQLLNDPKQYQKLDDSFKENQSLIRLVLSQNGLLLEHVPQHVITPQLVKLAVTQNPFALVFVPPALKSERLIIDAILQNPQVIYLS